MIKRVSSLKQFGIFRNFAWDSDNVDDFARYNLLYGWNYSGKTTLSRIISTLQFPLDTRTPEELRDVIEGKDREVTEALAVVRRGER